MSPWKLGDLGRLDGWTWMIGSSQNWLKEDAQSSPSNISKASKAALMVLIEAEVERITLKTKLDALQETYAPKLEEVQLKAALALRT